MDAFTGKVEDRSIMVDYLAFLIKRGDFGKEKYPLFKRQWADSNTNPYPNRPQASIDAEATIFIRAVNFIDIYCNRELFLKPANSRTWGVIGQISKGGFNYNNRTNSSSEPAFKLKN